MVQGESGKREEKSLVTACDCAEADQTLPELREAAHPQGRLPEADQGGLDQHRQFPQVSGTGTVPAVLD